MIRFSRQVGRLILKDQLKNVSIKANRSSCEDAINLINVDGNINNVEIKNSLSDGLDIDFSRLQINNLDISSSLNDCLDLSYGEYKLGNLNLSNCGDKGLSVGEKSSLVLNKIKVNKANTGIAVKDSSRATIEHLDIKNTTKCIHVYRKKQEFSGARIEIKQTNCDKENFYVQKGSKIVSKL